MSLPLSRNFSESHAGKGNTEAYLRQEDEVEVETIGDKSLFSHFFAATAFEKDLNIKCQRGSGGACL